MKKAKWIDAYHSNDNMDKIPTSDYEVIFIGDDYCGSNKCPCGSFYRQLHDL